MHCYQKLDSVRSGICLYLMYACVASCCALVCMNYSVIGVGFPFLTDGTKLWSVLIAAVQ